MTPPAPKQIYRKDCYLKNNVITITNKMSNNMPDVHILFMYLPAYRGVKMTCRVIFTQFKLLAGTVLSG